MMLTKNKIIIVDYDCGNLFSIQRALREIGAESAISKDPVEISKADRIILPGVGAFGKGIENIHAFGLTDALLKVASSGRPILGICLGMQLLLTESFEFGHHLGLNLIPGQVIRLIESRPGHETVKVPHIGWNAIHFVNDAFSPHGPLGGVANGTYMYFLHSYFVVPAHPEHCLATTEYGSNQFCSIIQKENITGVQFHPEISGPSGLKLLENFIYERKRKGEGYVYIR